MMVMVLVVQLGLFQMVICVSFRFILSSNPNFSLFNGDEVKSQAQEVTNTLFEGRLKEGESVTDPIVRTQIQSEAMQEGQLLCNIQQQLQLVMLQRSFQLQQDL
ncbi:hypothetical protein Hdeb2414_s0013g00417001 [Helianthus debilis subsp. tardiflorus]